MHAFWEIVASNSLVVVVFATCVTLLGRIWRNSVGLHLLWMLVLIKLITPPLITVHVPWSVDQSSMMEGELSAIHDEVPPSPIAVLEEVETTPASVAFSSEEPPISVEGGLPDVAVHQSLAGFAPWLEVPASRVGSVVRAPRPARLEIFEAVLQLAAVNARLLLRCALEARSSWLGTLSHTSILLFTPEQCYCFAPFCQSLSDSFCLVHDGPSVYRRGRVVLASI